MNSIFVYIVQTESDFINFEQHVDKSLGFDIMTM